jgi:hypothetical protein
MAELAELIYVTNLGLSELGVWPYPCISIEKLTLN